MSRLICLILALSAPLALADEPTYEPAPPSYKPIPHKLMPYNFEYGVNDQYSGANYKAQETADGNVVSGSYTVALPDGRIQTVTYTVDEYSGYVADVKYEGTPVYPKYEPQPYGKPVPPPPSYKPSSS
ncbi:Putative LOC100870303 [Caligus rogercresseyi]|uniref:LOC100870303 n=1 Tax=Caligus rogercresseyi TaxID=217165 RepID=A0A7T8H1W9_CALRO|nr:Putative LOC100870303 [Caligus rogercresseyi]QQP41940.1 Putative LOC100870303 [Caligus rogercresseyi]|eukprot:TRINITY_DN986_c0_g1_i1.p2 TRINITY_DN986_c0_g1~~TRINITY_DN986_c0_g1_i1.p2  ORF type:complete len:138 (+),score=49.00 TRINITY_DN986_c0_g1_i1:33-416(+)